MIKPTQVEVQKAIESSGYPLEIRVAHALSTRGYLDVIPSWDFCDDKTGESREIDVVAWRLFDVRAKGKHCQPLTVHLLIECKRSPAFVIYSTRPTELLTRLPSDAMSLSYFGHPAYMFAPSRAGWSGTDIVDHLELGVSRWKWPDCVGTHYSFVHTVKDQSSFKKMKEPKRPAFKVGDEEFYHRKLLGLLKGAYQYREPYISFRTTGSGLIQPHFLIPILVMDADMYEYDIESGSLRTITRGAICRSYRGEFSARFRIDVLQEQVLSSYLDELEEDFSDIASQIGKEYSLWERALEGEFEVRRSSRPKEQQGTTQ